MFDLLIKNISIADGSGAPMFKGCVAVKDGKIAKVAEAIDEPAAAVIEGKPEQILSPGFIDTHSHNDLHWMIDHKLSTQLIQGVTYDLCGSCGISAAPVNPDNFDMLKRYTAATMPFTGFDDEWKSWDSFGKYLESVKKRGRFADAGFLVGHGTLRIAVMGMDNRVPTAEELEKMKALLRDAMEAGAAGLSTGLIYPPCVFSETAELVELCKVVAEYDGIFSTHMRNESTRLIDSMNEVIGIAKQAGCKLLISHHKVSGVHNSHLVKQSLPLIQKAREEGLRVICDQYQSNMGSTTLAAVLPPFCHEGGTEAMLARLRDPETKAKAIDMMLHDNSFDNFMIQMGPDAILIVNAPGTPQYHGMYLDKIAEQMGVEPAEAVCRLELENNGVVLMAVRICEQSVVDEIFSFPYCAIGSDGIGAGTGTLTHPRSTSNQVHMLEDFVRNRKVVSWEEAIRKCTTLPADFLGLDSKGRVKEGADADIVIFNRDTVGSDADFVNPNVSPRGIDYVFVAGVMRVKDSTVL